MSAKEAYRRPKFRIEALPNELLVEVLRHATWVSYDIAPSDLVVKRFQSTEASAQQRKYMQSLVTKRYLIRVCKKWYQLAYLFLYEWIFVGKVKNLQGLVHATEQPGSRERENCNLAGWYTKRLDIDIRVTGDELMEHYTTLGPLLLRLLRHLDNLEVFTVGNCWDYTWLDPSVSHSWCPTLRVFSWIFEENPNSDLLDAEVWVHFLRSHPHVIAMKPSVMKPSRDPLAPLGFSHSLLTYSTNYMSPIPINTFTSLRRLSINLLRFHDYGPNRESHFMTRPLPSLTILQLNLLRFHGGVGVAVALITTLCTVRSLIHQFMPNLRRVELVLPAWPADCSKFIFPETIGVLGIRVCSVRPSRVTARFFLRQLNEIVQRRGLGGPLMIHFLDRGTLDGILTHKEYLVRYARKEGNILRRWIDCDGHEYELYPEEYEFYPEELCPEG